MKWGYKTVYNLGLAEMLYFKVNQTTKEYQYIGYRFIDPKGIKSDTRFNNTLNYTSSRMYNTIPAYLRPYYLDNKGFDLYGMWKEGYKNGKSMNGPQLTRIEIYIDKKEVEKQAQQQKQPVA